MKLLQGRPEGTFLLRLSSRPGALVVMYVKPTQEASPNKKLHDSALDVNKMHLIVRESRPATAPAASNSRFRALIAVLPIPVQLGNVLIQASTAAGKHNKFEIEHGSETMIASLKQLISIIPTWTHLFPDTPKHEALAGVR